MRDFAAELDSYGFTRIAGPSRNDATSERNLELARRRVPTTPRSSSTVDHRRTSSFLPWAPARRGIFRRCISTSDCRSTRRLSRTLPCYTALHVPADVAGVQAVTRLVPLAALLRQRSWPPPAELVDRLTCYGRTHGAWDDDRGYVEGSLARIVEGAAAWRSPCLPSVKVESGFLCGLEFDSLVAETAFFERHGLHIDDVEISIDLQPGELLLFDNLAVAHGRRGRGSPVSCANACSGTTWNQRPRGRYATASWLCSTPVSASRGRPLRRCRKPRRSVPRCRQRLSAAPGLPETAVRQRGNRSGAG